MRVIFPSRPGSSKIYDLHIFICVNVKMLKVKSVKCSLTKLPWQSLSEKKMCFYGPLIFSPQGSETFNLPVSSF